MERTLRDSPVAALLVRHLPLDQAAQQHTETILKKASVSYDGRHQKFNTEEKGLKAHTQVLEESRFISYI